MAAISPCLQWAFTAKKNGGARLLSRLTAIDTIIQLILLEALTPICEGAFSPNSFGYRPGRGVHMALEQYCMLGAQYAFVANRESEWQFLWFFAAARQGSNSQ